MRLDIIYNKKIIVTVNSSAVPTRGDHIDVRMPDDPDPGLCRVVVKSQLWVIDEGCSDMRVELQVKPY